MAATLTGRHSLPKLISDQQMLVEQLKAIVGPEGWTDDPVELEPHLTEWRELLRGRTSLMVAPATTAEVARVIRACADAGVGVVPQGGNTGLCGGAIPDESGEQVLLSLRRMNRIRHVDPDDFSMVVEAGCLLSDVQAAAKAADRLFALSLAAEGSCQIGGNLSTNAGGINVVRYGTARDQVLGLEVVLADGRVWDGLRTLRKDTAGYDLKQLFVGSEGTLGVITAAALRLHPVPANRLTALLALRDAAQAVKLLGRIRDQAQDSVLAFELISERAFRYVCRHLEGASNPFGSDSPWYVLLELGGHESDEALTLWLADYLDQDLADDAIVAKSGAEADSLWRMRHAISEVQKHEGASLKHDISVPVGRMAEFLGRAEALVAGALPGARPVIFGHVGDGNLHYNVTQPPAADPADFRSFGVEVTRELYRLVREFNGSISAEHGIGVLKKDALREHRSEVELDLMQTVKEALDPAQILNPGKVI